MLAVDILPRVRSSILNTNDLAGRVAYEIIDTRPIQEIDTIPSRGIPQLFHRLVRIDVSLLGVEVYLGPSPSRLDIRAQERGPCNARL
jgi:hypothetical protein